MRTITPIATATRMIVASAMRAAAYDLEFRLVAGENFFGNVARQLSGKQIAVFGILKAVETALPSPPRDRC